MPRLATLSVAWVAGCAAACASAPELQARAWQPCGYTGLVESIDALVGPTAIDCGFHNLTEGRKTGKAERRESIDCMAEALRRGLPFKFGTVRVPIDSYAYEIYARNARGENWMIIWDVMLTDDDGGQQWNRVCQSIKVNPKTLIMEGEGCVERSTGRLHS